MLRLAACNHCPITQTAKWVCKSCVLTGSISCFEWDRKLSLWLWERSVWERSSYDTSRKVLVPCTWHVLASSLGNQLALLTAWKCRIWYAEVHTCQLSEGSITAEMCWQLQLPENFLRKDKVSLENASWPKAGLWTNISSKTYFV